MHADVPDDIELSQDMRITRPVYLALLHYPVNNRNGLVVTTSVTNMDIHDISRTAKTYGVKKLFLVTPVLEQHQLVSRILTHWLSDAARKYHPDRGEAVSLVELAHSFEDVKIAIKNVHGQLPEVIMTTARVLPDAVSHSAIRKELEDSTIARPVLIVFGTGWGIAEAFFPEVHRFLAPVHGPEGIEGYNHLSVRAAAATVLDRLFGR